MDDLLARARCFKCGELEHLANDFPQNKEPTTKSETFFSGMVYNDSCNVHPRNDSRARDSRNDSVLTMTLETNPVCMLILETGCVLTLTFKEMMKLSSVFREDDGTFLDVQTDGVTLPVPGSSSSFSLGSVVVVGPRENVCSEMKLESDGGSDNSTSEPLAKSG